MNRLESVKLAVELAKSVCVSGERLSWNIEAVQVFIAQVANTIYEESKEK